MNTLLSIHSYLRYLVLLVGVVAVAWFAFGLATKRPVDKSVRILGSSFAGLLDTQILLGIIAVAMGRYYPALIGHIVMMVLATALAHVLLVKNRKSPNPGYVLPLIGVGGALLLIAGGIFAIGRGLLSGVYL